MHTNRCTLITGSKKLRLTSFLRTLPQKLMILKIKDGKRGEQLNNFLKFWTNKPHASTYMYEIQLLIFKWLRFLAIEPKPQPLLRFLNWSGKTLTVQSKGTDCCRFYFFFFISATVPCQRTLTESNISYATTRPLELGLNWS